jgi:predicted alpha/beta superfamily hydrolase
MRYRLSTLCILSAVISVATLPTALAAQTNGDGEDSEPIIIGQRTSIHSAVLNEGRPVLIYTPPGYDQSSDRYPVLYLLDGDGHFHHASGVTQFLSNNNRAPAMIVVGVPNLTQNGRTRDLTPPITLADTANPFPAAGGAGDFLRFLTDELQPWVESRYRTQPFDILVGHSFGGLFVTYALMENPDAFQAYLSISPSLWWDQQQFVAKAATMFDEDTELRSWLYMTMGNEGGAMLAGAWSLAGILETSAPESFRWAWNHMPDEDHGSVPHRSLYDGLEWIFEGWNLPNLFALGMSEGGEEWVEIEKHYSELSDRFGIEARVPEQRVNQIGYALLGNQRVDDAIRVFERNTKLYPGSANVYDSLGDAYDAACRWEEAKDNYGRAYRMAVEQSHANTDVYKGNLDRLTEKLASGSECEASSAR